MKLAFLIPTRNRAGLAVNAVESLLDRQGRDAEVFVSDNSSSDDEVRKLSAYCRTRSHPRLTYLRPPRLLTMGTHWDWAVREVLARSTATHLTVHYDRKYSKPGAFTEAMEVAARHPGLLITYPIDHVADEPPPSRLWQAPCTGGTYRIRTARVLALTAAGRITDMGHAWPVLSNCLVPREVIEAVIARYGNACDSVGPDSRFGLRFCSLFDNYLHFDRTLAVAYASHRSAGGGYLSGTGGDFGDFRASWGDQPWLDAAPIPGLNLGQNMIYHEYELVRREGGDLPPIDRTGYLHELSHGLRFVRDDDARARLHALLEEQGWRAPAKAAPPLFRSSFRQRVRCFLRVDRIRSAIVLALADRFGRHPRTVSGFAFRNDAEAIRYAVKYPFVAATSPDLQVMEAERV